MTNPNGTESASGRDNITAPVANNPAAAAMFNFAPRAPVKIPDFTPEDPEVWFQQVDWILTDAAITRSDDKFRAVMKTLDSRHAREVRDLVLAPPAVEPFRAQNPQIVEREEMGDRKPF